MSSALSENWWALRGPFAVLFGLIALFSPEMTPWVLVLVLVFGACTLLDGVLGYRW